MLHGKCVVMGICGGIAAYKAADLASKLVKDGAEVPVIMTEHATEFVTPLTFQTLTNQPVVTGMFGAPIYWNVEHISLAKRADAFVIVPATANIIGKLANGIADDMLSTTVMAARCPIIVAPAMNTNMYENPIVQANLQKLQSLGYHIIEPAQGRLACGDVGSGKLPEPSVLLEEIENILFDKKDLIGKKVLVTAGPTREFVDPVRYISNPSSGKMGYALARAAKMRGAEVTLVSGPVHLQAPQGVSLCAVTSADDMYREVMARCSEHDLIIKAAAVGDFKSKQQYENKCKKDQLKTIELEKNEDILRAVCQNKGKRFVVGFCMETRDLVNHAQGKLLAKGADMIVANDLTTENAGFQSDNNTVTILYRDGRAESLENMPKLQLAHAILDRCKSK